MTSLGQPQGIAPTNSLRENKNIKIMTQTNQENLIDDNDIAFEETDFKEKITEPFDPSKIRVDSKRY